MMTGVELMCVEETTEDNVISRGKTGLTYVDDLMALLSLSLIRSLYLSDVPLLPLLVHPAHGSPSDTFIRWEDVLLVIVLLLLLFSVL